MACRSFDLYGAVALLIFAPTTFLSAQESTPRKTLPGTYEGDSAPDSGTHAPKLFFGFAAPQSVPQFEHGSRSVRAVALTFDDGPGPFTRQVLDVLARHHARATFFMVGEQIDERPDVAREVAKPERGHEIGNHTHRHLNFCGDPQGELLKSEIARTAESLERAASIRPKVLRMPYGCHPGWAEALVQEMGYGRVIRWSVDGEDWRMPGIEHIQRFYVENAQGGDVLLMHDAGGDRSQTVAALEAVLSGLEAKGLSFITVSEMLALDRPSSQHQAAATATEPEAL